MRYHLPQEPACGWGWTVTHAIALSDRLTTDQRACCTCDGQLIDANDSFSSDINWTVYTCEKCLATVFTVEGRVHWWNHEGHPSEARRQRQDELRGLLLQEQAAPAADPFLRYKAA